MDAPVDKLIDHKDSDGLNNRRNNLRPCDKPQNVHNRHKRRPGVSKYKGVFRISREGIQDAWMAKIHVNSRQQSLGTFNSEEDAARAYDLAAIHYYGEFASPNFEDSWQAAKLRHYLGARPRRGPKTKTQYHGVYADNRQTVRYKARITIQHKTYRMGAYQTAEEAAEAFDLAALHLLGHEARLNFPERLNAYEKMILNGRHPLMPIKTCGKYSKHRFTDSAGRNPMEYCRRCGEIPL